MIEILASHNREPAGFDRNFDLVVLAGIAPVFAEDGTVLTHTIGSSFDIEGNTKSRFAFPGSSRIILID
jgi:hypothetical protein